MQSIIQRLRLGMSDAPDRFEILDAGRTHGLDGTELRKQTFLILLADTGDAVKRTAQLALPSHLTMIGDGESV